MTPGRRIPYSGEAHPFALLEQPGDYCGPVVGFTGDKPAVFFLLPIARDEGVNPAARSIHHVCSPPHVFRECDDGSLEIRESIGSHTTVDGEDVMLWHGYLDEGHEWRVV